jgi:hypothetical protein
MDDATNHSTMPPIISPTTGKAIVSNLDIEDVIYHLKVYITGESIKSLICTRSIVVLAVLGLAFS